MLWAWCVGMFNCYIVYVMSWKHLDVSSDWCRFCFEGLELGCKDHYQTTAVGYCRYVHTYLRPLCPACVP